MSEHKDTPRRWYAAKGSGGQGLVIDERDGRNVAVAYDKADAPLLAAAPELLDAAGEASKAIMRLVDHWDEHSPSHIRGQLRDLCYEALNPAIAKAEGQP